MKEYVIKSQMANLTEAEQKVFLKGLIKNAKATKRANEFASLVKQDGFPMALIGSLTTFLGITGFGLALYASGASPEIAAYAKHLAAVGAFATASGALALFRADTKNKTPNDQVRCAKVLADVAKEDLRMLKKMYREVGASAGR